MPTTINKQRILHQLLAGSKTKATAPEVVEQPILNQFAYAICREGATCEQADRAYQSLLERFFDWNEIRVSSSREIQEAMAGLPGGEQRAIRLIAMLQEVFETTFSFDLEPLLKKGVKQAAKQLARYEAASDFAVAWIIQHSFAGHAIPLDEPANRVLRRLGLLEADNAGSEEFRTSLEHIVPKARGFQFVETLNGLAHAYCSDEEPACSRCPMVSDCMTGQENTRASNSKGPRGKPR